MDSANNDKNLNKASGKKSLFSEAKNSKAFFWTPLVLQSHPHNKKIKSLLKEKFFFTYQNGKD